MIPDKIYIPFHPEYGCVYDKYNFSKSNNCIEYTRTPIAKKFSEEKPDKAGTYLVRYAFPSGALSKWGIDTLYEDGTWDFKYCEPYQWAEIVLPIVKDK